MFWSVCRCYVRAVGGGSVSAVRKLLFSGHNLIISVIEEGGEKMTFSDGKGNELFTYSSEGELSSGERAWVG